MATPDGDASGGVPGRRPAWSRAARYLPFVAVAAAIGAIVAVVGGGGGGGDGGDDGDRPAAAGTSPEDDLTLSGPMTPIRAELEGIEVDFGPGCDAERGQIMLPNALASPCVEPFEGDNGGATSMGVAEDEILVVQYLLNPELDPVGVALLEAAGVDTDPDAAFQTMREFADVYNEVFETYGRRVVVERYDATGTIDDEEAARADAIAIAEMEPFAVVFGPQQAAPVFAEELASRGVICGGGCAATVPESIIEPNQPFILDWAPTPEQVSLLAAEMIGKLAGPGPAELAGDPVLRDEERRYGLVWFDRPDGDQAESVELMREALAEREVEIAPDADIQFELDLSRVQENARTMITRLKEAGVTTVIYRGDPLTPQFLTEEATDQDYHPEWILGPSLLADTTVFGRGADGDQWRNGFGLSTLPARGERATNQAFRIYDWAYGGEPPSELAILLEPSLRALYAGIQLAGPELTPESYRDGMFRIPLAGGGPTVPQVSWGDHGVWPELDLGGIDDAVIIWWDPDAEGEDETGDVGRGMYRYANGAQRYTLGSFPESLGEAGLFDEASSVTVFDEVPPEDRVPDYPRPDFERVLSGGG